MKFKTAFALALAVTFVGSVATALIASGPHDLSGLAAADNGETCVYCHTPHQGDTAQKGPLWNKGSYDGSGWTTYTSSTIDMTVSAPGSASTICLGCHDGGTAADNIINAPTNAADTPNYTSGGADRGWGTPTFNDATNLDTGASEHPVGITYDTNADGDFKASPTGVILYGTSSDTVECMSCHDVHNYTNIPFLRTSNTNSALCLACHTK